MACSHAVGAERVSYTLPGRHLGLEILRITRAEQWR